MRKHNLRRARFYRPECPYTSNKGLVKMKSAVPIPTVHTVASRISPRAHRHTLLLYCDKYLKFNDVVKKKKCLPNARGARELCKRVIIIYYIIRCAMCISCYMLLCLLYCMGSSDLLSFVYTGVVHIAVSGYSIWTVTVKNGNPKESRTTATTVNHSS